MSEENYLSPFNPVLPPQQQGTHCHWGRLYGASKSLAISAAARSSQSPVLVITTDAFQAGRLIDELNFFLSESNDIEVLTLSDWETLPYDLFSPYQDIISERLTTLAKLPALKRGVIVVPVTTAIHRLLPRDYLSRHSLQLKIGQTVDIERFKSDLISAGYSFSSQVMEHGDAAIRGSLFDIYPMGSRKPYRIDLFDDEIDSIRTFDPETQRSEDQVNEINILPAREIDLTDEGIANFRSSWRERFQGNPGACPVYRDVSQGLAPAGIEYFLPLFYQQTSSLLDYFETEPLVILDENISDSIEKFLQDVEHRYEQMRHDVERPILPPWELYLDEQEFYTNLKPWRQIHVSNMVSTKEKHSHNYATTLPTQMPVDARLSRPLELLERYIDNFNGRVLIVAESSGRRETLLELFRQNGIKPVQVSGWPEFKESKHCLAMTVSSMEQGLQIDNPALAVISEGQLFGDRVQQRRLRRRKQPDSEALIRNLTELTIGAPVVHEDHGVGRYQGLVTLTIDEITAEFILIEYAQNDKLYVPVSSLDLISRYTGADPEHAPLHRLGSGQWEKAKQKAARRVYDVAAELLELQARRAARPGYSFTLVDQEYQAFIQAFPFEETPGQQEAIEAVISDMKKDKPMDRLVCGDAGFGKTEVAMRAAFIAVQNSRQVALLVPTTLLAQQHYQNFKDRFADWPVCIESLSRFRSVKEQERVLQGLEKGTVDIVIGTHKLIQGDVNFERLGLLIIDEEHRFGVRQKEKFKALRSEIDILTLTATPIPRTLNMALSNIREFSIIATPPSRRLSVKTFVHEWNNNLLQEALLREIKRGGQVYFLHNKIDDIEKIAKKVESLMPEAKVRIAHGQMPEKELEQVMLDFYHRRFSVLVCTTIIESGIDVPSANTIIINRADKFGLAQLYQLRGRVGRSHHRAYAYLFVPPRKAMTADAIKRLEAIESLEELGIGFTLATHDLEIRGAGEILGEEQSGQIHEIGFGLYMDLLERAVQAMRVGMHPQLDRPLEHGAEINLHIPALIPEDYLPDVHMRLIMYKRIASARTHDELKELQEELIDRFGLLPEQLKNLFQVTRLKLKANPIGISKIDLAECGGRIQFNKNTRVDPGKIINLIQSAPHVYKLDAEDNLRIYKELSNIGERIILLESLLNEIALQEAA